MTGRPVWPIVAATRSIFQAACDVVIAEISRISVPAVVLSSIDVTAVACLDITRSPGLILQPLENMNPFAFYC